MRNILLTILLLSLYACSSSENGVYKKNIEASNQLKNNLPAPWREIPSEGSDLALENTKTKSYFLFNSACRKYEGSNLNALNSSILSGIEQINFLDKKNTFYQEREALEVLASGKLDGVERFFRIITIQKNNCIYDYVLISINLKNTEADTPMLRTFLERIVIK
ncbi:MAG: hypothetical protein KBD76_03085 [Bacteriovorax sp.]|nr:hypothetical protein [Bacteriovorax sp.]